MEKHSYLGDGDSRNWNWDERVDPLVCEGSMCVRERERASERMKLPRWVDSTRQKL